MRFTLPTKIYAVLIVVLLSGFAYAGARHYRVLSFGGTDHWKHEYRPGIHMLRHK